MSRRRLERVVLAAFGRALPAVNWACLIAGVAGAFATACQLIPGFGHAWWGKLTSILLWLLMAREGYEPLAAVGEDIEDGTA